MRPQTYQHIGHFQAALCDWDPGQAVAAIEHDEWLSGELRRWYRRPRAG